MKKSYLYAGVVCLAMCMTACGDADKEPAGRLLTEARQANESGDYDRAIALLDSLDRAYPKQIDIRREGMHLRPSVIEGQTLTRLTETDSLIAVTTIAYDAIRERLVKVDNPVEPYYVGASDATDDVTATQGLHARMAPDGIFSVLSVTPEGPKHTFVRLSAADDVAESANVPYDGEVNERSSGMERITLLSAQADTLGSFAVSHAEMEISLTFGGGKECTVKMPQNQVQALAEVYTASQLANQLRRLGLLREQLEQQLMLSRSQQARTFKSED